MAGKPLDLEPIEERFAEWERAAMDGGQGFHEMTTASLLAGNDVPRLIAEIKRVRDEIAAEMNAKGYPSPDPVMSVKIALNELEAAQHWILQYGEALQNIGDLAYRFNGPWDQASVLDLLQAIHRRFRRAVKPSEPTT